ncbi:hypothetical protein DXG01_012497 [Tephrocybe rancida]|nr:hypothetical protein DXG01_012497 [Tephrocybe rancida]
MNFLAPNALSFVKSSLGSTYSSSLGPAATFIGDIGQPLHVEAYEVGGNDVSVKCSGSTTNLHSLWGNCVPYAGNYVILIMCISDTGIITKLLAANYSSSVTTWASTLSTRIKVTYLLKHGIIRLHNGLVDLMLFDYLSSQEEH